MRNERKEKLVFNFVSSSAGIVSEASYSHKVLFSIDIVHRFIKESPSPSPSRDRLGRGFLFLLFLVSADEGDFGVVGRELVLHRGALGETGTDALDVGVAFTCFEANPAQCHRTRVINAITRKTGVEAEQI